MTRFLLLTAFLLTGCAGAPLTAVSFRTPPGSALTFERDGQVVARATFPQNLEFEQFATPGSETRGELSGTVRINELVEEQKIPSVARSLLIDGDGGIDLPVKGYFQVFKRATSAEASLTTFAVDLSKKQLEMLLTGQPAKFTIEDGGTPVLELTIGLKLK